MTELYDYEIYDYETGEQLGTIELPDNTTREQMPNQICVNNIVYIAED